jgi:hypothetical protein
MAAAVVTAEPAGLEAAREAIQQVETVRLPPATAAVAVAVEPE